MCQETVERILPLSEVLALVYGMRGHVHQFHSVIDLTVIDRGVVYGIEMT